MLRFALVMSVLGLVAATAVILANELSPIERPEVLWALFAGIFLAFVPAVMGHPKATYEGGSVNVDPRHTLRSAPWWSTALMVVTFAIMIALALTMPETRYSFGSRADLIGRPDRVRMFAAFANAFFSVALHVALSGLKAEREFLDYLKSPP